MKKLILLTLILFSTLAHADLRRGDGADVPPGTTINFAGANCPVGFLKNDGSAVSRATYSKLFSAISTAYGIGNGTTTFNLPQATLTNIQAVSSVASSGTASVVVTYGNVQNDSLSEWNGVDTFTPKETGSYSINAYITFIVVDNTSYNPAFTAVKNGVTVLAGETNMYGYPTSANSNSLAINKTVTLIAGEPVRFLMSKNFITGGSAGTPMTTAVGPATGLSITRVSKSIGNCIKF